MAHPGNPKKKLNTSGQNIRVVVRVRPLSNDEREKRVRTVVQCISMREVQTKEKKYQFDRVFEPDSSQMDIYSFVVAPMISDVLAGYNCTVFAYGQTGTGKTHTMTGGDPSLSSTVHWKEDERAGCIPRAAANIFDEIGSMKVNDYNVRVSFLELYNEEVRDLLSREDRPPPLNIFNDNKGSVCIQNLNEITVSNSNDIYMLLQQGTVKRQTASTLMNNHSSRSHTVFTITVHIREATLDGEEVLKTGKINLVDLAGSENIAKSGAKDKRAQELANINRSLLTLGRVIQILAERNNKHVPYRDSKLTRILQDSLGGHTKTCIIATVSPSHTSYEETQSTLEYACRARDIRNTPMINEKVTKAQMMKEMTHEIEKLKKDLDAARSGDGFFIDRENWDDLKSQLQCSSNALNLKNDIIDDMKKKLSDLETIRDIKEKEFGQVMNDCQNKEELINKAKAVVRKQKVTLAKEQYISRHYLETATENNIKAKELLEVTKNLSKEHHILQTKLKDQYSNNYSNEQIVKEKSTIFNNNLVLATDELDVLRNVTSTSITNHTMNINSTKSDCTDFALNYKMSWENENRPLIQSKFKRHSTVIQDCTQNTTEGIDKSEEEINKMLGLVTESSASCMTACEDFTKYDDSKSSKMAVMESLLTNVRSRLLNARKKKEEVLHDLERFTAITKDEICELDGIISSMENSKMLWNNSANSEEEQRKLNFKSNIDVVQHNHQLLSKGLQNTRDDLDSQRKRCVKNEKELQASSQEIKDDVDQVMSQRLKVTETFVNSNVLKLNSLEENVDCLNDSIENQISEIKTILHGTEETAKELLKKMIPVKRTGDTPKQNSLNYPKRIGEGAVARNVLIKRFKEEFNEDVENDSILLNVSSESIEPLDTSHELDENKGSCEEFPS